MQARRSQNPFLLALLVVGMLGGLSLLRPGLTVAGVELRPVRLLADVLRPDPEATADALADAPPPNGPASGPGSAATATTRPVLPAQALPAPPPPADSAEVRRVARVPNLGGLSSFVAALRQAKAGGSPVRIAYFGDSMIEGDMITGELRNLLQQAFGGSGVGFVPMTSITAAFRETIHQTFSDNWYGYDLKTQESTARAPLGMSGFSFLPRELPGPDEAGVVPDSSWTQFRAGPPMAYPTTRRLALARLLYGPGDLRDQVVVTTDGHAVPHALTGTAKLNEMLLRPGTPARQMRLAFAVHGARPVYGVSFESPQGGITLDNYSFRGNSGLSLTKIPFGQLAAFGKVLDYRLIVLHYGVNIADARNKNYAWYDDAMTRVVDRMQRAFPGASILIVGMSDKASRIDGTFQTDPSVPRLLRAQRHLAERNHAAFWNLFEAMGGENSMVHWVEDKPALANHDYTHVNYQGGRKVARMLFDYLMGEYNRPTGPATPTAPAPASPDSSAAAEATPGRR